MHHVILLARLVLAFSAHSLSLAQDEDVRGPEFNVRLLPPPQTPEIDPPPSTPKKSLEDAVFDSVRARPETKLKQKKIDAIIAQGKKELVSVRGSKSRDRITIIRATLSAIAKAGGPTAFLATDDDQDFAAWQSAFSGALEGARVPQIGVKLERLGAKWFIAKVYAGSAAERAGLMDGDQWVSTDGQPAQPIQDLKRAKPGTPFTITVRRRADGPTQDIRVTAGFMSVQEMLATHMERAHRTMQGQRPGAPKSQTDRDLPIAYVALPAASHQVFRDNLSRLASKYQAESHAMILDLRHGMIGPDATYVEAFFGEKAPYTKPLVVLVDQSTGGGRERLAELLQKTGRGTLVGQPTQGLREVLDFHDILPGEAALIYAVPSKNPKISPESRSLIPDTLAQPTTFFSAGADPSLTKALSVAAALSVKGA
jgi:C-terminal processing protease CtpA/Prc